MSSKLVQSFRWVLLLLFICFTTTLGVSTVTADIDTMFVRHGVDNNFAYVLDLALGDMDGNGRLDIVAVSPVMADSALSWWRQEGPDPAAWTKTIVIADAAAYFVFPADIDGDQDNDLLASLDGSRDIVWLENVDGLGTTWTEHVVFGHEMDGDSLLATDMDGDHDLDILAGLTYSNEIAWWENVSGDGTGWQRHDVAADFNYPYAVTAADIDSDGDMDVIGGAVRDGEVAWWENRDGAGRSWVKVSIDTQVDRPYALDVADIDGNGRLDVVGAAIGGNMVAWWQNIGGDGSDWWRIVVDDNFPRANDIRAADVDGDGRIDLVGTAMGPTHEPGIVRFWQNQYRGFDWIPYTLDSSFPTAQAVAAGDMDNDGDVDIVAAAQNDSGMGENIAWWQQQPRLFVVNTTADDPDALPGDTACATADGSCTLRAALEEANATRGRDTIHFAIPGPGPHTIRPLSPYPALIESIVIDGYTQPGAVANTNPAPLGLNTQLMVAIDGSAAGLSGCFQFIETDYDLTGIVIRGLAIHGFPAMAIGSFYVEGFFQSGADISGNFIGTDTTGAAGLGNGAGVMMAGFVWADNMIGGPEPADRNLISGNGVGIIIAARYPEFITIQGNLIGSDVSGAVPVPNGVGIELNGVYDITIGGDTAAAANVIAGNNSHGVYLVGDDSGGTVIAGNLIGLNGDGQPLGNGGDGIHINDFCGTRIDNNQIGYNQGAGITTQCRTVIHSNAITQNGELGIDIGPAGVTPNDPFDSDYTSTYYRHSLQNFPLITDVSYGEAATAVSGILHSTPNYTFTVDLFASSTCDPSGYGEGEMPLGSWVVQTDAAGNSPLNLTVMLPRDLPFVTATATNIDTSEFSPCRADPLHLIDLLMDDVVELVADGRLDPNSGFRLLQKLSAAQTALLNGYEQTAVRRLSDFVSLVRRLVRTHQLSSAEGQALIDGAWEVVGQIRP